MSIVKNGAQREDFEDPGAPSHFENRIEVSFMVIRSLSYAGMLFSLFLSCLGVTFAQQPLGELPSSRLVSAEEGEAIVQAAWELRRSLHPKPDCSHFAHAAYAQAGFDYEYAQSRAIFAGIASFQRVQKPQPGDLVVWQGHVGIVVDPVGQTFYSSVLAGFAIEDYRSNYWTNRGKPRFYRYVFNDLQTARLLASFVATYAPHSSDPDVRDVLLMSQQPSKDGVSAAVPEAVAANEVPGLTLESHPSMVAADKVTVAAHQTGDAHGWAASEERASEVYGRAESRGSTDAWRAGLRRQRDCWIVF